LTTTSKGRNDGKGTPKGPRRHGQDAQTRRGAAPAGRSRAPGPGAGRQPAREPRPVPQAGAVGWREAIAGTVAGLGYELVDVERGQRGLLRVTIDRIPGRRYAVESESVTVDDCEAVTRQLQYALEVEGLDYARLEVSSPGLDRPLKSEADFTRFAGQPVHVTLKAPFNGRKVWQGVLGAAEGGGWQLVFREGKGAEQVLGFQFDEVREARLVPVVNFKGRQADAGPSAAQAPAPQARTGSAEPGPASAAEEAEE
jgi:ribosome maturation factor RimP